MRAEPFRFMIFMEKRIYLRDRLTDFAFNLGRFFPIVKVEKRMRCSAASADSIGGDSSV